MGYAERQEIIGRLQELRGSRVLTHINSDRRTPFPPNLPAIQTKLGTEAQPYFVEVLRELGPHDHTDLFLHTGGGQTDSVWPLVSLIREFSQQFSLLVPFKAHSAGTLIALGADDLLLSPYAELSPVDPKTGNQFSPVDETDGKTRRAISVEEVTSYFDLANDPAKSDGAQPPVDPDLAFRLLAEKVHPVALGNVNRTHSQIRELARRLLGLHVDTDQFDVETVVDTLTQGRYSHTDILNRREAQSLLGDEIARFPSDEELDLMEALFDDYVEAVKMKEPFVLKNELDPESREEVIETVGAFIETESTSMVFRAVTRVRKQTKFPQGAQLQIRPGQEIPLVPGMPVELQIEPIMLGWTQNKEGL